MKRLVALAVGCFMSVFLITVSNAAPAGVSGSAKHQQGLENSKKAMQSLQERQKKVRETKKQAYAKRQQAQSVK